MLLTLGNTEKLQNRNLLAFYYLNQKYFFLSYLCLFFKKISRYFFLKEAKNNLKNYNIL